MGSLNVTFLMICQVITSVLCGFPFMNTDRECQTMLPSKLKTTPKKTKVDGNPFEIHTSDTMYGIFSHVQVHVTAQQEKPILGMMIQSRLSDCVDTPANSALGQFEFIPGEDFFEFVNCFGKKMSAVTNKVWSKHFRSVKTNFVISPKEARRIHFVATIVTTNDEIWTGFRSESIRHYNASSIKYKERCPQPTSLHQKDNEDKNYNDTNSATTTSSFLSTIFILGLVWVTFTRH